MNNNTQKPNRINEFFKLILGILLLRFVSNFLQRSKDILLNFKDFFKKEKKEVEKLSSRRESFKNYCANSYAIFHEYFIPSPKNDHKPRILRPRSLVIITIISTLIKVIVVGYLFFIYPNQAIMSEVIVKKIFELTNKSREVAGLKPLAMNTVLSASATAKANDMIANNYFAHHSPTGKKPWDWISRADYPYILVGENLAMNFASADAVHKALMDSPTHKKNIMNEKYRDIGLAMVNGKIDEKDTIILVELFATTGNTVKTASAPAEETPVKIAVATEEPTVVKTETVNVLGEEKTTTVETPKPVEKVIPKIEAPAKVIAKKETAPVSTSSMREEKKVVPVAVKVEEVVEEKPVSKVVAQVENVEAENNLNNQVVYMTPEEDLKFGIATTLIKGSNYIYAGLAVLMVLILLVNIFVRFSVQHKPVIIQSLLVIIFIISLASVKIHVLENIVSNIALL